MPDNHLSFESPIIPGDAQEIRSPCLMAFGRHNLPGPFVEEYLKGIAPITTTSPNAPLFQCDFKDLGRAMAHFQETLTSPNDPPTTFSTAYNNSMLGDLSGLGPASFQGPESILMQVPIEPLGQELLLVCPPPAFATLLPATRRTRVVGDRTRAGITDTFADTRPSFDPTSQAPRLLSVPSAVSCAPTPFPGQHPPPFLQIDTSFHQCPPASPSLLECSSVLSPFCFVSEDPSAGDFSITEQYLDLTDSESDDEPYGSESDYLSDPEAGMDYTGFTRPVVGDNSADPPTALGDVLIASDRLSVCWFAMLDFIHYLSFDPVANVMVADPPTYEMAIISI
ncbi:hypothetical protein F4604DRAFT_1688185 [Suillus subluteus]|nr:hypothetical protein F4604DRAFT_1688185 [Suillus subluteus]